mmetsp:Transcript_7676/g.13601  ORF Transcript_7676/g.13601 Transcript_7676/m.13601 type:complete len:124 (-) Transcript_7676:258-629(-)
MKMKALPEWRRVGVVLLLCLALGALPIIGIISMVSIASAAPALGMVLLLVFVVSACCCLAYAMLRRELDDEVQFDEPGASQFDEPGARQIGGAQFQDPAVNGSNLLSDARLAAVHDPGRMPLM